MPSDRMLMFLLRHLSPAMFAEGGDLSARADAIARGQASYPEAMAALVDTDVESDCLDIDDYRPKPPSGMEA